MAWKYSFNKIYDYKPYAYSIFAYISAPPFICFCGFLLLYATEINSLFYEATIFSCKAICSR